MSLTVAAATKMVFATWSSHILASNQRQRKSHNQCSWLFLGLITRFVNV